MKKEFKVAIIVLLAIIILASPLLITHYRAVNKISSSYYGPTQELYAKLHSKLEHPERKSDMKDIKGIWESDLGYISFEDDNVLWVEDKRGNSESHKYKIVEKDKLDISTDIPSWTSGISNDSGDFYFVDIYKDPYIMDLDIDVYKDQILLDDILYQRYDMATLKRVIESPDTEKADIFAKNLEARMKVYDPVGNWLDGERGRDVLITKDKIDYSGMYMKYNLNFDDKYYLFDTGNHGVRGFFEDKDTLVLQDGPMFITMETFTKYIREK